MDQERTHEGGSTKRFGDGEMRSWVNAHCFLRIETLRIFPLASRVRLLDGARQRQLRCVRECRGMQRLVRVVRVVRVLRPPHRPSSECLCDGGEAGAIDFRHRGYPGQSHGYSHFSSHDLQQVCDAVFPSYRQRVEPRPPQKNALCTQC